MAQMPFSIHEAAILLEVYLKINTGALDKKSAINLASKNLRRLAENKGINIDTKFRNFAGILFRMQSMESAYKGFTVSKPATKLFSKIVELYNYDNNEYIITGHPRKFCVKAKLPFSKKLCINDHTQLTPHCRRSSATKIVCVSTNAILRCGNTKKWGEVMRLRSGQKVY